MVSTIRLLTNQKVFIHFQRSYSILAAGTLIQQATRFSNIYFPGNGFIRLFAPFVTAKPFQIPTDNKSVLVNSKIEVKDEISKLDTKKSNNLNKNITDILKGYDRFRNDASFSYCRQGRNN